MKFCVFIASLLMVHLSLYAQPKDSLVGKWKFHDFYNAPSTNADSLEMARRIFGDLSLYFAKDQRYKMNMLQASEEGSWQWDEVDKLLVLTADKGTISRVKVVALKDQMLTISLGKPAFVLSKTRVEEKDLVQTKPGQMKTVAATNAQISKKWYFTRREIPGRTEEEIQRLSEIAAGTYYDFRADGSFTAQVLGITAEGKWELGDGNTSVVLTIDDDMKIWNIQHVSETELELVKGNTQQVWKFSTKEKK